MYLARAFQGRGEIDHKQVGKVLKDQSDRLLVGERWFFCLHW